jgi:hypothetical protein
MAVNLFMTLSLVVAGGRRSSASANQAIDASAVAGDVSDRDTVMDGDAVHAQMCSNPCGAQRCEDGQVCASEVCIDEVGSAIGEPFLVSM